MQILSQILQLLWLPLPPLQRVKEVWRVQREKLVRWHTATRRIATAHVLVLLPPPAEATRVLQVKEVY
jgi:hypothetical protein